MCDYLIHVYYVNIYMYMCVYVCVCDLIEAGMETAAQTSLSVLDEFDEFCCVSWCVSLKIIHAVQ